MMLEKEQQHTMLRIDPIWLPESQQQQFRHMLEAMARPGECYELASLPQNGPAVLSILATLLDKSVTLADPDDQLRDEDWLMLQARPALAEQADYILCDGLQTPEFSPRLGNLSHPEQSATLIICVNELSNHAQGKAFLNLRLKGPGIADTQHLYISGLHYDWIGQRRSWNHEFPMGVDMIFIDQRRISALPRTTHVEVH